MDGLPSHELRRLRAVAGPDGPLDDLVARRLRGEPLQYIEGSASFGPVELAVDERVLIPRPETEGLFDLATKMVRNPEVIVDLCTGSGALALALKKTFPAASVMATENSAEAVDVARANSAELGLEVAVLEGDLFEPIPESMRGQVDLLVANPPYVAASEYDTLPDDVKLEPKSALVAGPTGLEVIQRIGASAADWVRPGGVVLCEIGEAQGVSASSSFVGLPSVVRQDLAGRDRYLVAVRP